MLKTARNILLTVFALWNCIFIFRGLGYRVFFSPVSLNGISGEEYEPYIYNALNTATVMLVYGSRESIFSST